MSLFCPFFYAAVLQSGERPTAPRIACKGAECAAYKPLSSESGRCGRMQESALIAPDGSRFTPERKGF